MSEFERAEGNEERESNADIREHKVHCCHDESCPNMCKEHDEAEMPTPENEHSEPGNIKDREELNPAVHKGEYPGFIRKLR
jgi:hypothetical protein